MGRSANKVVFASNLAGGLGKATRENFEYLVATLSKSTKGKKYENFVVNYIWYALNDPSLKPVTQQYVNRAHPQGGQALVNFLQLGLERETEEGNEGSDGTYALIDLFFPQLHVGVECDESGHYAIDENGDFVPLKEDAERTEDIKKAIPDYLELRIPVQVAADNAAVAAVKAGGALGAKQKRLVEPAEIIETLDGFVEQIRQRKAEVANLEFAEWAAEGFKPWDDSKPDWMLARAAREVRVGDGYLYKNNGEYRALFDRTEKPSTKPSNFSGNIDKPGIENHVVWGLTLSKINKYGEYVSTNSLGILNVYYTDESNGRFILEAVPTQTSVQRRAEAAKAGIPKPSWPPYEYTYLPADYDELLAIEEAKEKKPEKLVWDNGRRITFGFSRDAVGRTGFQFMGVFESRRGEYLVHNGITFKISELVSEKADLPL